MRQFETDRQWRQAGGIGELGIERNKNREKEKEREIDRQAEKEEGNGAQTKCRNLGLLRKYGIVAGVAAATVFLVRGLLKLFLLLLVSSLSICADSAQIDRLCCLSIA